MNFPQVLLLSTFFDELDIAAALEQVEDDHQVTGYLGKRLMSPETEYEFKGDDW